MHGQLAGRAGKRYELASPHLLGPQVKSNENEFSPVDVRCRKES
jgi:hypothetical protein